MRWLGLTAQRWGRAFNPCTLLTISRRFLNCRTNWSHVLKHTNTMVYVWSRGRCLQQNVTTTRSLNQQRCQVDYKVPYVLTQISHPRTCIHRQLLVVSRLHVFQSDLYTDTRSLWAPCRKQQNRICQTESARKAVISLYTICWTEYALVHVDVLVIYEPALQVNVSFKCFAVSFTFSEVNKYLIPSSWFQTVYQAWCLWSAIKGLLWFLYVRCAPASWCAYPLQKL